MSTPPKTKAEAAPNLLGPPRKGGAPERGQLGTPKTINAGGEAGDSKLTQASLRTIAGSDSIGAQSRR